MHYKIDNANYIEVAKYSDFIPDPNSNASGKEIPNIRFEVPPMVSHNPAKNSTTPVHATWKDLLPGRYQNPQAPWTGIMFSKPVSTDSVCCVRELQ